MATKPYHDKDWLQELYVEEGLTLQEIANRVECSKDTIWRWKNKHDIKKPWKDESLLREKYVEEQLSMREIGEELGCDAQTIKNQLDKFGIETRSEGFRRGNGSVNYYINNWGHAHLGHTYQYEQNTVFVHRLLAVAEYGIEAVKDKEIHHKNGVPWDNRPENIEPVSKLEHSSRHHESNMDWRDEETLVEAWKNSNSLRETAEKLGCTAMTARKWLLEFGCDTSTN